MKLHRLALLALLVPGVVEAHISVASGPAAANKSQKITFGINHGCPTNLDTYKIKIDIPAHVTSVRALYSDFGNPVVTKAGVAVTSIEWTKPLADIQAEDVNYYELTIRAKLDDVPFSKIPFTITQTCRAQGSPTDVVVVWSPGNATEPAPAIVVLPSHLTGWNKVTLTTPVLAADMGVYFGDAQIVWKGTSAFSANPVIATVIGTTTGVTALTTDLVVGDEIWVKY